MHTCSLVTYMHLSCHVTHMNDFYVRWQSEGLGFLLQYIKAQQGDDEEPAAIEEAEEAAEEEMEEEVEEGE